MSGGVDEKIDRTQLVVMKLCKLLVERKVIPEFADLGLDEYVDPLAELARLREENERLRRDLANEQNANSHMSKDLMTLRAKYEGEGAREVFFVEHPNTGLLAHESREEAERHLARLLSSDLDARLVTFREVRE